MFDFDTPIDRSQSDSSKWQLYAGQDVLPMWVADMDFAAPPAVTAAVVERATHGVFGYGDATPGAIQAVVDALQRDYGWPIAPEWLVWLPGLVVGLNVACRATGGEQDPVLTATPIYPPFMSAPQLSNRPLNKMPLRHDHGEWHWDFDALQAALEAGSKTLMLCNPHNPVGRVWRRDELERLAHFAEAHDITVISDEIHCDLILDDDTPFIPFASLPGMAARTITLMAPSKTYNVPGLGAAFAVIPDAALRQRFERVKAGIVPHINLFGYVACEAAYRDGAPWRAELLQVLRRNRDLVVKALDGVDGVRVTHPQATYLAWIDCRAAGIENPKAFFEAAGVGLSDGAAFGAPGFVRLNFGCPLPTLQEALRRMRDALVARAG